jgi:hypothetical protein
VQVLNAARTPAEQRIALIVGYPHRAHPERVLRADHLGYASQ